MAGGAAVLFLTAPSRPARAPSSASRTVEAVAAVILAAQSPLSARLRHVCSTVEAAVALSKTVRNLRAAVRHTARHTAAKSKKGDPPLFLSRAHHSTLPIMQLAPETKLARTQTMRPMLTTIEISLLHQLLRTAANTIITPRKAATVTWVQRGNIVI